MKTRQFRLTRTLWIGSLFVLSSAVLGAPRLLAQSQDDQSQSVADAARKAKERKKAAAKNNPVITDDTIRLRPASADSSGAPPAGTVATSGGEAAPTAGDSKSSGDSSAPAAQPGGTPASADADAKKAEKQKADIAKLKELLAEVQKQLDLMKRKFDLDSDNFYSQPDYAHDSAGKAKLDELQKQIGDQKVAVDDVKQQLEKLIQEAGVSADSDKSPATPQN